MQDTHCFLSVGMWYCDYLQYPQRLAQSQMRRFTDELHEKCYAHDTYCFCL